MQRLFFTLFCACFTTSFLTNPFHHWSFCPCPFHTLFSASQSSSQYAQLCFLFSYFICSLLKLASTIIMKSCTCSDKLNPPSFLCCLFFSGLVTPNPECRKPPIPEHGHLERGHDYFNRTFVTFRCDPGFRLSVPRWSMTCTDRGWQTTQKEYAKCLQGQGICWLLTL